MLARCGNIALRDIAHMGICPIHTDVPHTRASLSQETPGEFGSFYSGWQTATSLQSSIGEGARPGEVRSLLIGRAVWRQQSFPGSVYRKGFPLLTLGRKGLKK